MLSNYSPGQFASDNPLLSNRIEIIDTLRGFALLGILLMNIPGFGMPYTIYYDLTVRNEFSGPNYIIWWIVNGGFEGTMRGLFSMLFGASMMLFTNGIAAKSDSGRAAELYNRRLIWLLIFGLFDAFIIQWPGDILYSYAICGFFLLPARSAKPKTILLIASVLLLLFIVKDTWKAHEPLRVKAQAERLMTGEKQGKKLSEDEKATVEKWKEMQQKWAPEAVKKQYDNDIKAASGNYGQVFNAYSVINQELQSVDFYQHGFLDCLIFMLIGIALFKLDILTGNKTARFYLMMALIGYAIALPLAYLRLHNMVNTRFNTIALLQREWLATYEIRRLFQTLGNIGLLLLVYKLGWLQWLYKVIGKVGKMAFSNYLMQNIISTIVFYGYGFKLFGKLERFQLYYVVLGIWAFNILFSVLWLRYFKLGPFEWVWRSLTYWKVQRIRKDAQS